MGDITNFFDDVTHFSLIYNTNRDRYMKSCPSRQDIVNIDIELAFDWQMTHVEIASDVVHLHDLE
jgi:hypothetical protein